MTKRAYIVTENAGRRVAGRRVEAGDLILLTDAQAAQPRRDGAVVREPVPEPSPEAPAPVARRRRRKAVLKPLETEG